MLYPNNCDRLTEVGNYISRKSRSEASSSLLEPSKTTIMLGCELNKNRFKALRSHVSAHPWVLVMGPGLIESSLLSKLNDLHQSKKLTIASTQWSNFRSEVEIDILMSAHVLPLMASLYHSTRPKSIIHGVYSRVPPVLVNSCTATWSDPYLDFSKKELPLNPESVIKLFKQSENSDIPYIPCPRNALFFVTFMAIFLGAKHVTLCGFDPLNPVYFFSDNIIQKLDIAQCLSKCDPWISAWDGRNERIPAPPETAHRQLNTISDIINAKPISAASNGWRLEEMKRGIRLLQGIALELSITVDGLGSSSFLDKMDFQKINL